MVLLLALVEEVVVYDYLQQMVEAGLGHGLQLKDNRLLAALQIKVHEAGYVCVADLQLVNGFVVLRHTRRQAVHLLEQRGKLPQLVH